MALSVGDLETALLAVFDGSQDEDPQDGNADGIPSSAMQAGQRLAFAYLERYAVNAQFGASTPGFTGQMAALASTLGASLAAPGLAATHAAAWAAGLTAFWTGVVVSGAQNGVTLPPPGAAALVPALTALFSVPTNTAAVAAAGLAAALHTATMTVTAAVTSPPGTILPIS